jgi:effector-binding domain-containing protein
MQGRLQTVDILIKRLEPFHALTLRRSARTRAERELVREPIGTAVQQGLIQPSGIPALALNIYYEDEFRGDYEDYEICIPVSAAHPPSVAVGNLGVFTLREIPAAQAATYLHQGDYDALSEKYLFLQRWAVENNYQLSGVWRFVWHRGPMHRVPPAEYLTELQHPIEPAGPGP